MADSIPLLSSSALLIPRLLRHRFSIHGDHGPYLVLQHGFGTDQSVWRKVLPMLAAKYRVVLMDLAGAGPAATETFDLERYADIEAYADDLLLALHEAGIEECIFVGSSVGAMVGMLAAIERPEMFRRLIFLGASPRYLNDGAYVGGFDQESLDGIYQAMSDDYHGWVSGFARLVVHNGVESSSAPEFAQSLFALRPDIALSTARAIFQSDFRARLPLLEVPTVLLQTRRDVAVPREVALYLHQQIRRSTLEIIEAEGHFPHLTAPRVVADAILRHAV